jgi:hypothetical protein
MATHSQCATRSGSFRDGSAESALPDACFAGDKGCLRAAACRYVKHADKLIKLVGTVDENGA